MIAFKRAGVIAPNSGNRPPTAAITDPELLTFEKSRLEPRVAERRQPSSFYHGSSECERMLLILLGNSPLAWRSPAQTKGASMGNGRDYRAKAVELVFMERI